MKKCVALFMLLLCVSLFCSCGKAGDGQSKVADSQLTVTSTDSGDSSSAKIDYEPVKDNTDSSAPISSRQGGESSDNKTNQEDSATNSSTESGTKANDSSDSGQTEAPPFTTDEYELPFVPNS